MKARLLKKILNTRYNVHGNTEYVCVGSPLCSDLISVHKKELTIKYALDSYKKGRASLSNRYNDNDELLLIWDKLQELIDSGEIKDIIEGVDELEKPLPVYTIWKGLLVETTTDEYGWPNTTVSGELMYNNTYFKTRKEALEYGINENSIAAKWDNERLDQLEKDKIEALERLDTHNKIVENLQSLLHD